MPQVPARFLGGNLGAASVLVTRIEGLFPAQQLPRLPVAFEFVVGSPAGWAFGLGIVAN